MVLSDEKIRGYIKRLLLSRMRILINNGFYGLLLMHIGFALNENISTAATDGEKIMFSPDFLDTLSDRELDFVLMHEIVHIALRHYDRIGGFDEEKFNIACDIVVNSNILLSENMDKSAITLSAYGESMHLAPDGSEGYNYTVEQLYSLLPVAVSADESNEQGNNSGSSDGDSDDGIDGNSDDDNGNDSDNDDDNDSDGDGDSDGDSDSDGDGNSDNQGKSKSKNGKSRKSGKKSGKSDDRADKSGNWDDHSHWNEHETDDELLKDLWVKRIEDAGEAISIRDSFTGRGTLPMFAKRILKELRQPQTDWRTILDEFIEEEICDYSFTPPDRRFSDSPFFLPDFNEKDDKVEKILFMIDTSGSMSDKEITAAYSEIKGAIDQFGGKLSGWLGFFDAEIIEPVPFSDEDEFRKIEAAGGGGTDFGIIFEYVKEYMSDDLPVSIIILTDGYAPFPDEAVAMNIPVLWLINNEEVEPPWGKVARIRV